ncbi:MAG: hypothetical protein JNM39_16765 [Bdellovibrionaceae bacterium]|nr:hypothetical protein [Pseudobdellovibrionaceae bacterium]
MKNINEVLQEDEFTLKRQLAILLVQQRKLKEHKEKLKEPTKRHQRPRKPVARNAELWPEQAMMILKVGRRKLNSMLKTGQLADLHPYSIGMLTGLGDPRSSAIWKKKYDYWKLQWADYNAWKKADAEKRAENAMKLAQMLMGTATKNT